MSRPMTRLATTLAVAIALAWLAAAPTPAGAAATPVSLVTSMPSETSVLMDGVVQIDGTDASSFRGVSDGNHDGNIDPSEAEAARSGLDAQVASDTSVSDQDWQMDGGRATTAANHVVRITAMEGPATSTAPMTVEFTRTVNFGAAAATTHTLRGHATSNGTHGYSQELRAPTGWTLEGITGFPTGSSLSSDHRTLTFTDDGSGAATQAFTIRRASTTSTSGTTGVGTTGTTTTATTVTGTVSSSTTGTVSTGTTTGSASGASGSATGSATQGSRTAGTATGTGKTTTGSTALNLPGLKGATTGVTGKASPASTPGTAVVHGRTAPVASSPGAGLLLGVAVLGLAVLARRRLP